MRCMYGHRRALLLGHRTTLPMQISILASAGMMRSADATLGQRRQLAHSLSLHGHRTRASLTTTPSTPPKRHNADTRLTPLIMRLGILLHLTAEIRSDATNPDPRGVVTTPESGTGALGLPGRVRVGCFRRHRGHAAPRHESRREISIASVVWYKTCCITVRYRIHALCTYHGTVPWYQQVPRYLQYLRYLQ